MGSLFEGLSRNFEARMLLDNKVKSYSFDFQFSVHDTQIKAIEKKKKCLKELLNSIKMTFNLE